VDVMENVMSKMGQFVMECQTIADEAYYNGSDVQESVETQFSDRDDLKKYAEETIKQLLEDIPF